MTTGVPGTRPVAAVPGHQPGVPTPPPPGAGWPGYQPSVPSAGPVVPPPQSGAATVASAPHSAGAPPAAAPYSGAVPAVSAAPQSSPPGLPGFGGTTGVPPQSGPVGVGMSGGPPVFPAPAGTSPGSGRRPAWPGVTALVLVFVLLVVAGVQAFQIYQLSDQLDKADRKQAQAQAGDTQRLDGLEGRTEVLEKHAGNIFNPEAIAAAVLPSVFRVRAGQFTGTAFAVGQPTANGGANLFTNFHVVESVWNSGGREVFLERTDQRYPATIVDVDKENDVAHLRTDAKFTGLVTAQAAVKSGQQIVVVGAPLGLEDSVTSGVVSATRKDGNSSVIQFDAPINPGNSGGPVINGSKEVVGIATAKARNAEGIGLAVPIKIACDKFRIC
ncbi:S1C family serine protease [Micromonospora polyrhachis]